MVWFMKQKRGEMVELKAQVHLDEVYLAQSVNYLSAYMIEE